MTNRPPLIAVCGASSATAQEMRDAEEVGRLLAERGAVVVCGGLGGVMEGVARGVRAAGGTSIGLLPGDDAEQANSDIAIAVPTGMGEMRNLLIARSCSGMIAVGGGYGTLGEIAHALRLGRRVAALRTWAIRAPGESAAPPDLCLVETARDAVNAVLGGGSVSSGAPVPPRDAPRPPSSRRR